MLAMTPELNRLLAEKVLGWQVPDDVPDAPAQAVVPDFATPSGWWLLMERHAADGCFPCLSHGLTTWRYVVYSVYDAPDFTHSESSAPTPGQAIAEVALRLAGLEPPE